MSAHDTVQIYRSDCTTPLCRIRIAEVSKALEGELDVFIHAASGTSFERITVQRPDQFIDYHKHHGEINACTWHGNYMNLDGRIAEPKINLKSRDKKLAWTALDGVINQKAIFMFPVFSLYIPAIFCMGGSKRKGRRTAQELLIKLKDVRIDFFLLPKDITREMFEKLTVSKLFLHHDITMFNRQMRGALIPLDGCELQFNWYKLRSWWSLIRCVYPEHTKITQYWIYFHDTLDPLGCILDRGYSPPISNTDSMDKKPESQEKLLLRDLHEEELIQLGLRMERPS